MKGGVTINIGNIFVIVLLVGSVLSLIQCYLVVTDKVKLSKSAQVCYCIVAALSLFGSALRFF